MFDDNQSTSGGLSTGAKVSILVAVPFICLGLFFLFAPITELRTHTGGVFGCGTAINAPADRFKSNICGPINSMYMYRGLLAIAAGVLIAVAGFILFGRTSPITAAHPTKPARASKSAPTPLPDDFAAADEVSASNGSRSRSRTFD